MYSVDQLIDLRHLTLVAYSRSHQVMLNLLNATHLTYTVSIEQSQFG